MKLLANENFPRAAVESLRGSGHDVLWARTAMPGEPDEAILIRAQDESRIVVTFDKDFGELAFRWGLMADCGVILVRLRLSSPENVADKIGEILAARSDWPGHFAVVEESRVRMRPLPTSEYDSES